MARSPCSRSLQDVNAQKVGQDLATSSTKNAVRERTPSNDVRERTAFQGAPASFSRCMCANGGLGHPHPPTRAKRSLHLPNSRANTCDVLCHACTCCPRATCCLRSQLSTRATSNIYCAALQTASPFTTPPFTPPSGCLTELHCSNQRGGGMRPAAAGPPNPNTAAGPSNPHTATRPPNPNTAARPSNTQIVARRSNPQTAA